MSRTFMGHMNMRSAFEWFGGLVSKVFVTSRPMFLADSICFNTDVGQWIGPSSEQGMDSLTIDTPQRERSAEERFRNDLLELCKNENKIGCWVLFSKEGLVEEGPSEDYFYGKYADEISKKKFFVGRIIPEPPVAEVNANWFVHVDRSRKSDDSARRR